MMDYISHIIIMDNRKKREIILKVLKMEHGNHFLMMEKFKKKKFMTTEF